MSGEWFQSAVLYSISLVGFAGLQLLMEQMASPVILLWTALLSALTFLYFWLLHALSGILWFLILPLGAVLIL